MIELELDGKTVISETGTTILEVALKEGKYIPHFCYHKKLSVAANCRMCLVEVEKMPKPMPACATPITEGMKIHTCSKLAVEAQKGVMEFLLINHPLDCPICDQGGECQLQDLAVGYGASSSRFNEAKRAVSNKELGPLIATEMTRCIHCSRCVRFSHEIAGYQELGMSYRSNHVEVMPFIGQTINSELSGNMIDVCPVGALTSKPFRHHARTWELSRRKSIAPHDGLGSNIIVQVDKYHKVARVLPMENEAINECWLSDRDRFSYSGLYHEERATMPMIKQDGKWINVEWEEALQYVAKSINMVKLEHDNQAIGVLAGATSTTEELYLLQKLMRKLDIDNLDYRLNQVDFSGDENKLGVNFLGGTIANFIASKSVLVIGSMLRQEQPLLAHRIRQAVKHGMQLNVINVMAEDLLCQVANQVIKDPREIAYFLAQLVKATQNSNSSLEIDLSLVEISPAAQAIANSLIPNSSYIVVGEIGKALPDYGHIMLLVQQLAKNINGQFGSLAGYSNEVGAQLAGFLPYQGALGSKVKQKGLNAYQMFAKPRQAYLLFNTEPEFDAYDANLAMSALAKANLVIVMNSFVSAKMKEYADVILPITPFTETAGSFVNMEGKWQKFNGVTKPLGLAKPGWKVIRVLANQLDIEGFEQNSISEVQQELANLNEAATYLTNQQTVNALKIVPPLIEGLVRIATLGPYAMDSITRRAPSLQQTNWGQLPSLIIAKSLADKLGLIDQATVKVEQGEGNASFNLTISQQMPESVVFLAVNDLTAKAGFTGRFAAIKLNP